MNTEPNSKNERAEKVVGLRPTGYQPLDYPCELGYHCPVCKYKAIVKGNYDERLEWSEYNGFIWCRVCNKDYPSCLCVPLTEIDKAIDIFLSTVADAQKPKEAQS